MAQSPQRILVASLDAGDAIAPNGWQMNGFAVEKAALPPKFGRSAVTFRGVAQAAGGKGDFGVAQEVPGQCQNLSLWVNVAADSNVASMGLQVWDSEGEYLIMQVPVDWTGWKQVSFDLPTVSLTQTWPQNDKNKKIDFPIKGINIVWFAKDAGPTSLTVDALTATTQLGEAASPMLSGTWSGATIGEAGQPLNGQLVLTNFRDAAQAPSAVYSIQRDPAFYSPPPIDPTYGSDIALGAKSWTEEGGKRLEEGSLTDGKDWTSANAPWGQHTETLQFVDLGQVRHITHLTLGPSDGNWLWKIDVAASLDGKNYQPVPSLQGVDFHKHWEALTLPLQAPFDARYLRLRHHNDGQVVNSIAMPSRLSAYDGLADENWNLPHVGEVVAQGVFSASIAPRSFDAFPIDVPKPLAPGAYLVAVEVKEGDFHQLIYGHYFVKPPALAALSPTSRFGLNVAQVEYAPQHRRLGIGWVRFENFKWQMISPAPHVFKYDGTVGPWFVNHDAVVDGYTKEGISVLPFLFQTPEYATSAGPDVKSERHDSYPPKDNALYSDFTFQTAARYGAKKQPDDALETPDKKSGLDKMHVYELWNEPNLQDKGWGPWVGTTAQYLETMRAGSEGIKRADPTAQVTNGGWAGIDLETVEPLAKYRYADGKKPLDFVDILNVHYYSGRIAPEVASVDGNQNRSGATQGSRTFEDDLRRLTDWRDANKPGMPIWMTETGYDSAGSFGTDERTQAARLPRVVMMMLAAGIDKVFVYRETGSTPSMHAASGLMRNDGSYKPSWFTYATLIRQLDKVTSGQRLPYPDPNVRLYAWKRGDETILSAWTIEGTGNLDLKLGNCRVVDAFGQETTRDVAGQMPLSIYPLYLSKITNSAPIQGLIKAANQADAARLAEKKRLSQIKAYLFDFGSVDKVGTLELGTIRPFTPVLSKEVYDEAKGYGFVKPAMSDEVSTWMDDPLERDAVRIGPGTQFEIKAEPGRYTLRLSAYPLAHEAINASVKGAAQTQKTTDITQEKTIGETTVDVGSEPVVVTLDSYAMLRWISLIKQ